MGSLTFSEILTIVVIILIVFGPNRLPELARRAGRMLSSVRESTREIRAELQEEYRESLADLEAAKQDLKAAREELASVASEVSEELEGVASEVSEELASVASEVSEELEGVASEVSEEIKDPNGRSQAQSVGSVSQTDERSGAQSPNALEEKRRTAATGPASSENILAEETEK